MNFKKTKKIMREMDEGLSEDDEGFKVACILFLSAFEGPNIKKLAKVTPYSRSYIADLSRNFRKNEIWKGGRVACGEWEDKETGGVAFWLHVNVGLGYVERATAYSATNQG